MRISPKKYAQALAIMLDTAERAIIANFLAVLRSRRQLKYLPRIMRAFDGEWLKHRGIKKVEILYPDRFPDSLAGLEKNLKERLGDKLKISAVPASNLIGGFKVRIGDTLMDASVASQLKALERKISH